MYKSTQMQNSWPNVLIVGILAVLYESFLMGRGLAPGDIRRRGNYRT